MSVAVKPARAIVGPLLLAGLLSACGGTSSPPVAGSGTGRASSGAVRSTDTTNTASIVVRLTPWSLPAPVSRPVVVPMANRLVILGGLAPGDVSTSSILVVDPSSGTVQSPGQLEEPVHDAAGATLGATAYVFGGGSYSTVAAVQAWDGSGPSTVAGSLPVARSDLSAAVVGGTAYILGGYDGTQLQAPILSTQDGTRFKVVGQLPQPVRYGAAAVGPGGSVWLAGGELGATESGGTSEPTNDIQRFDPSTGVASVVAHLPVALGHASAFFLGGELYVAGGRSASGPLSQIWRLDPASGQVTLAGSLPGPRSDAGVGLAGKAAYLIGGEVSGPTAPLASVVKISLG